MPGQGLERMVDMGLVPGPAFLIPGPREVLIVGLVVLALYGRSLPMLLRATPYGRLLTPWVRAAEDRSPRRRAPGPTAGPAGAPAAAPKPTNNRLFWALALTAAAAAAAWVATRVVIQNASVLPPN